MDTKAMCMSFVLRTGYWCIGFYSIGFLKGGGQVGGMNYIICESLFYHVRHDLSVHAPIRAVMCGLLHVC